MTATDFPAPPAAQSRKCRLMNAVFAGRIGTCDQMDRLLAELDRLRTDAELDAWLERALRLEPKCELEAV